MLISLDTGGWVGKTRPFRKAKAESKLACAVQSREKERESENINKAFARFIFGYSNLANSIPVKEKQRRCPWV